MARDEQSLEAEFLPDREDILTGRFRRRPRSLLFLIESWTGHSGGEALDFLGSTEVFGGLDRAALQDLLTHLEPVPVPAGETVLRQGEIGDCLYLVGFGRLQAFLSTPAGERVLGEAGPGHVVGEAALLLKEPRSASVRAVRDSLVLRLSAVAFARFAESHPSVVIRLFQDLTRRLAPRPTGDTRIEAESRMTIAVVPSGGAGLPSGFGGDLVRALRAYGSAVWLTAEAADRALGFGSSGKPLEDPHSGAVLEWLHRLEQQHNYVLCEVDATPTAWSRRCLRQADRILLVGRAGTSPRLSLVESELLGPGEGATPARRELALVHDPGTSRPVGTAAWLSERDIAAHHHLDRLRSADYQRLARFIAGRAVGLVLGGGGARGAAHLGVMQALDEAGIVVDVVGGTSVGAPMAAAYAMGWDHAARVGATRRYARLGVLVEPTLPLVSLSSARRLEKLLAHETIGDVGIEDLWTSFFCVSANLSRAEEMVHDRGELWRAVRASLSVPGLLPPVFHDGDLLVDGAAINNLPVDIMRERVGTGRIIAVDLRRDVDLRVDRPFECSLSGWRLLTRRLRTLSRHDGIPDLVALLMRAGELGSARGERATVAAAAVDLHLRPPVGGCGFLDFKTAPRVTEASYRYTKEQLRRAEGGLTDQSDRRRAGSRAGEGRYRSSEDE